MTQEMQQAIYQSLVELKAKRIGNWDSDHVLFVNFDPNRYLVARMDGNGNVDISVEANEPIVDKENL